MTIKKNLIGGHHLSYTCPKCGDALCSPLPEAGAEQTCPKCGAGHVVPGKEQVVEFLIARKQQKEEEATVQEAERQRRKAIQEAEVRRRQAEQEKQQREWRGGAPLIATQQDDPVDYRRVLAALLCGFGGFLLFCFAFMYRVTLVGSTVNLKLLQDRLIGCHVGIGLLCTGLVLWGLTVIPLAVQEDVGGKPREQSQSREPPQGPDTEG